MVRAADLDDLFAVVTSSTNADEVTRRAVSIARELFVGTTIEPGYAGWVATRQDDVVVARRDDDGRALIGVGHEDLTAVSVLAGDTRWTVNLADGEPTSIAVAIDGVPTHRFTRAARGTDLVDVYDATQRRRDHAATIDAVIEVSEQAVHAVAPEPPRSPPLPAATFRFVVPSGGLAYRVAADPERPPDGGLDAGAAVEVVSRWGDWAQVRTPHGEIVWVDGRRLAAS